jgi:hypothetical protein
MGSIEEKVRRPVKYLTAIARRYPDVWKWVDRLRANRDKIPHDWPAWCYLPSPGAAGIVEACGGGGSAYDLNYNGALIATLGSWRVAKDIYLYDETVFEELWNTPIEGKLPIDVLHKLPTICAYIAFHSPRDLGHGGACHGFFVHLDHSTGPVLRMTLDFGNVDRIDANHVALAPYGVELHQGKDLLQCLQLMHDKMSPRLIDGLSERFKRMTPEEIDDALSPGAFKSVLEPLVSLTVYLCSTSAEIRAQDPLRGLRESYTKKTKRGVRTFVPETPQVWEVAFRIGATLRAAAASAAHSVPGDGSHASPRPHIRRAHWHHFWTGPKAAVGKPEVPARELVVKWIPPTPVAMGPDGEIVPTVHRVY